MTAGFTRSAELELRELYEREQARVRDLEVSQRQLEIYARDLQEMFGRLQRQLSLMDELHNVSIVIGSVLEPEEVMARTLDGLGRLLEHDLACIYLVQGGSAVRGAMRGHLAGVAPPSVVKLRDGRLGEVLAGRVPAATSDDGLALSVGMRAGGVTVGAVHIVRSVGEPFTDENRKLAEVVAARTGAAIQNARLYEQTKHLASRDPQTGLYNYRYFRDALEMEIARARRLHYVVGLLMLDLDNFKLVNDTCGHLVGDDLLRDVAGVMQRNLRQTDVLARYGGEEFAVILPGLESIGLQAVGEKLRRATHALAPSYSERCKHRISVTMSVGGVARAASETDAVGLIRDADAALYEAKRRGKDQVYVPFSMNGTAGPNAGAGQP